MEKIEPATPGDVPELVELLNLLFTQEADFKPDRAKQERGLRLIIGSPNVGVILAARDGGPVLGSFRRRSTTPAPTASAGSRC